MLWIAIRRGEESSGGAKAHWMKLHKVKASSLGCMVLSHSFSLSLSLSLSHFNLCGLKLDNLSQLNVAYRIRKFVNHTYTLLTESVVINHKIPQKRT